MCNGLGCQNPLNMQHAYQEPKTEEVFGPHDRMGGAGPHGGFWKSLASYSHGGLLTISRCSTGFVINADAYMNFKLFGEDLILF